MIDTHAHIYLKDFKHDYDSMLERARECGLTHICMPAISASEHQNLLSCYQDHPQMLIPMVGLHPCYVKRAESTTQQTEWVRDELLSKNIYRAVGEIGIDLYHTTDTISEQIEAFEIQIGWAKEKNLPIVIHCRDAYTEVIDTLSRTGAGYGILHCFTGTEEDAETLINMGFKLGIGGVVTYKNAKLDFITRFDIRSHIVLETDAPYLSPVPHRGRRNEPAYVSKVAEKLALLYDISTEEVIEHTTKTAKQIFGIS